MGKAEWGADPEFFGPRHAHREDRLERAIRKRRLRAGLHLECAAGVGSLSITLARTGATVVAADMSLRSLAVVAHRAEAAGLADTVLAGGRRHHQSPFRRRHLPLRIIRRDPRAHSGRSGRRPRSRPGSAPGGWLLGTVPADPSQWSDWDDWGGHLRRYQKPGMTKMLSGAGLEPEVTVWGWPMLRIYDDVFMKRVNRRRLHNRGSLEDDPALAKVSDLGKKRWLVNLRSRRSSTSTASSTELPGAWACSSRPGNPELSPSRLVSRNRSRAKARAISVLRASKRLRPCAFASLAPCGLAHAVGLLPGTTMLPTRVRPRPSVRSGLEAVIDRAGSASDQVPRTSSSTYSVPPPMTTGAPPSRSEASSRHAPRRPRGRG